VSAGVQADAASADRLKVLSDKEIARAIGKELRSIREAFGWSRGQLVAELPSGIGDRTLLSYDPAPRGALFYPL
jgi:hypothetical protein